MPHVIGKPTMCYTLVKFPGKDFYIFCIGFLFETLRTCFQYFTNRRMMKQNMITLRIHGYQFLNSFDLGLPYLITVANKFLLSLHY